MSSRANAFIPTPPRVMAITQLCLAFTLLLFILGYPFMGEHYLLKSRLLIFDAVIESNSFSKLPVEQKNFFIQEKDSIKSTMSRPFMAKLFSALKRFAVVPQFKQAWIVASIVIALLILLKVEGAASAAWILPILVSAYSLDNHLTGKKGVPSPDERLFPSEKILEEKYLGHKLSGNIFKQREELLAGWHLYLIKEWTQEEPAIDQVFFKDQVARGEFAFNVKRATVVGETPLADDLREKDSFLLLLTYFAWNVFFAWFINRSKWRLREAHIGLSK